ncbi:MAG TPA: hypothetical protein DCQ31_05590, partial [Bacteroidales bacterium]|nr:hypothetical protein [Bacteroidales bacterium]
MPGLYQYKLDGLDKNWSEWNSGTTVNYTRLPTGTYKFYVRSQDSNGVSTNTTELIINVLPPWYNSKYFALVLVLLGVASSFVLRFYLKRKWKKQKQKLIQIEKNKIVQQQLESEQRIILLENEKLQNEIGHKNSQLASTTMAIISKNEVLNEIKTELEAFKVELGTRLPAKYLKKIYSLIDQNIAGENDWKVFENYFDQAHENFLQRLKLSFPDLTPGDLKLCAYLRMNLSSKEIAQLLNISIRGVEVHRYRLRKRLKLDSNSNLV